MSTPQIEPDVAVSKLDAILAGDPESAHGEADKILLAVVPPKVAEAYRRAMARCPWWAAA